MAFCTGYGVEIGLLIDVYATSGVGAIAQVDLDVRQNRHQPLEAARADGRRGPRRGHVAAAAARGASPARAATAATSCPTLPERPPLAGLRALEDAA